MDNLATENLEKWMSFYYKNPQPDTIPVAIDAFRKGGYFSQDGSSEPIIVFLSLIFRSHPQKIETWLSSLKEITNQENIAIGKILWLSNTEQARKYLTKISRIKDVEIKEYLVALLKKVPPEIEKVPIASSSVIDILWAAFMATGEDKYVVRIISAFSKNNNQDELSKEMISSMAKWSLKSNVKKHEKVKSICLNQLKTQNEDIAIILQEIID